MRSTDSLRATLVQLDREDPAAASDAALARELIELRRLVDAVEARWLRRLAAFDARGAAAGLGAASTAGWLRSACRLSPGSARARVQLARRLDALPATADALTAGEVSVMHAQLVATATAELADFAGEVVAAEVEAPLVEVARRVDPLRLRREIAHARHALAPEAAERNAERVFQRRWLSASETLDGMVAVDGLLDPEGGAVLLAALAPLAQPAGADDARTAAQRRADGLVELARRGLDVGGLAVLGGERPHLTVTVALATLERRAGARAADTGWAGPVTGEAARRLACDAGVSRVVTAGRSEPLDVGRRSRTVPPAIRTALAVRDGGCVFPNCDRPPPWTDAHHVIHWADGGATAMENLVLLCRRHHRAVHEGGWQLSRAPDGGWAVQPPCRAGPSLPGVA